MINRNQSDEIDYGDLDREELQKAAAAAVNGGGPLGHLILQGYQPQVNFKFTCTSCGERCTLNDPNCLYESGECHACGETTKIEYGGFILSYIRKGETDGNSQSTL